MKYGFLLLIVSTICLQAHAGKIKVNNPPFRKPSDSASDGSMANSTFIGFLKCADSKDEAETLKCIKRYFSPKTSDALILRYSEAFQIASEYTELYYCDEKKTATVKMMYPEKKYELFFCFQSNMRGEKNSEGTAFFEKSEGMPKLIKLQM